MTRHVLRNLLSPDGMVQSDFPLWRAPCLAEAWRLKASFLGLGGQPGKFPTWGTMIAAGRQPYRAGRLDDAVSRRRHRAFAPDGR